MRLRAGVYRAARVLGVVLATLSLVHAPLPQPDFHNIRHHDAPGELCEHHDHLLRWHPRAGQARDVSVLHWHWFLPATEPLSENNGPALHAHLPDWSATQWDGDVQVTADVTPRPDESPRTLQLAPLGAQPLPGLLTAGPAVVRHGPPGARAAAARADSLTSLLHRWVC